MASTILTIDKAGRIVIPKPLCDRLNLEAGDAIELDSVGECITLRPLRGNSPLAKEQGVWVFRAGQQIASSETDDFLQQMTAPISGRAGESISRYLALGTGILRRSCAPSGQPETVCHV